MKRGLGWLSRGVVGLGIVAAVAGTGWAQAMLDAEAESKQIKTVIDEAFKASNAHNIDQTMAQYADDARIDSKVAGSKISKSAYREQLTRAWSRDSPVWAEYGNLQVSVADPSHAVAQGMIFIHLHAASGQKTRHIQGGPDVSEKYEWRMEKRDGRWLIVETSYK
ncbi:MAG TPA: hypothetical protein VEH80_02890 [Candidatus Bathyarchaeia archaeon]|nr:hypothetical protein [Candidatus Bathyarchaeia archaeon]